MKLITRLALFGLALALLTPAARSGEEEGAIQLAKFAKKFRTKEDRVATVREGDLWSVRIETCDRKSTPRGRENNEESASPSCQRMNCQDFCVADA